MNLKNTLIVALGFLGAGSAGFAGEKPPKIDMKKIRTGNMRFAAPKNARGTMSGKAVPTTSPSELFNSRVNRRDEAYFQYDNVTHFSV